VERSTGLVGAIGFLTSLVIMVMVLTIVMTLAKATVEGERKEIPLLRELAEDEIQELLKRGLIP